MRTLFVLALLIAPAWGAEPLAVGDALPALTLRDQHGEEHQVDAAARAVLFTRDMDAGAIVKTALADDGGRMLEAAGAVYVADVSRMPGLVRRMIAIPRMRRRGYRMLLDEEGEATARLPGGDGTATLLVLDARRITAIERHGDPEALRAALAALAVPPASE